MKWLRHFFYSSIGLLLPLMSQAADEPLVESGIKGFASTRLRKIGDGSYGGGNVHFLDVLGAVISVALGFVGIIFIVITIYGGFLWMTARGNSAQVDEALKYIRNGIIGAVIIFASYVITAFVFGTLLTEFNITG